MAHYALYVRVSTFDQTVDPQILELKAHAARIGWSPLEIYSDVGVSGAKCSRPDLDRLLNDCRKRKIKGVMAAKLDRLGRSLQHMVLLLDELGRLRIPVVIPSQGIDTTVSSPIGQFQIAVLAAVAEFERGIITERVHAGIKNAKAKGVHCGRPTKVLDLELAKTLRAQGKSFEEVAAALGCSTGKAYAVAKGFPSLRKTPVGPITVAQAESKKIHR